MLKERLKLLTWAAYENKKDPGIMEKKKVSDVKTA